jgi:predicted nuclease with TOPRIM domain
MTDKDLQNRLSELLKNQEFLRQQYLMVSGQISEIQYQLKKLSKEAANEQINDNEPKKA